MAFVCRDIQRRTYRCCNLAVFIVLLFAGSYVQPACGVVGALPPKPKTPARAPPSYKPRRVSRFVGGRSPRGVSVGLAGVAAPFRYIVYREMLPQL